MKYLVDTCTLIWALQSPRNLSRPARDVLENGANDVLVSVVSFWEISWKHAMGKLTVSKASPDAIPSYVEELGWTVLPLDSVTAATIHHLPARDDHRDPFDRLLVWIAITRKVPLISSDSSMTGYTSHGLHLVR